MIILLFDGNGIYSMDDVVLRSVIRTPISVLSKCFLWLQNWVFDATKLLCSSDSRYFFYWDLG